MGRRKSNKNLEFEYDLDKPYVYVKEKNKQIGVLGWDSRRKKWLYKDYIPYDEQKE